MLRIHYSRATTPAGAGFDDEITNAVQVGSVSGLATSAAVGEVATSSITLDDPTGTIGHSADGIVGLRRMYVVEDSAPAGDQVVWNGYIGTREYRRGEDAGITPIGAGRQVVVELNDDNAIAHFRIITGTDGNRPAETADARLRWILGSTYGSTIHDDGLVVYPSTAMDAVDYRGQTVADVLSDLSGITGYNWWCAYNETTQHVQLFFDEPNTSTAFTSTLQISNVAADIDATTTFAPRPDAVLRRDPSRVAAGVYLPYAKGSVYVTNYDTSYNYAFRDHAAPSGTIATEAKALAAANRFLADNASEDDRATVTVRLPASKLTGIKAGHRIQCKFSHFPAPYNGWRWWRVLRRTVAQAPGSDQAYDVTLELSPQPGSPSGAFASSPASSNPATPVLPRVTTPGNLLVLIVASSPTSGIGLDYLLPPAFVPGTGGSSAAWNVGAAFTRAYDDTQYGGPGAAVGVGIWWRRVAADETTTSPVVVNPASGCFASAWLYEFDTSAAPIAGVTYTSDPGYVPNPGTATMPSLSGATILGAFVVQQASYEFAPVVTSVSGIEITNAGGDNRPFTTYSGTDWRVPWTWIGTLSGGGALAVNVRYDPHGGGTIVNHYGVAGAAIALPVAVRVPTIPYPANQV